MPEWLSSVFAIAKEQGTKAALAILLVTGLILFLPLQYLEKLGVAEASSDHRLWIGLCFLTSLAIVTVNFCAFTATYVGPMIRDQVFIFLHRSVLRKLTPAEKMVLRPFILDQQASVTGNVNDGVMELLQQKNVISRASSLSLRGTLFSWILQPWAREYLEKNPQLLD